MKIAFNPSTVAALITPPNNKDITFDLRGRNIFARGVKFQGTDTWRDIKINNVSIDSNILDLQNGSNTTLTNTNGVVTINSTWRPVVDNLTSDSTTSSLSANQGRVLAGLINSKSDSEHNHDDRYLRLTGGIMQLGEGLKFHADNNYFGTDSDARIISLLDSNDKLCDGGLIIDERSTLNGTEYVTELLRIRDSEFKWRGSNILHSGNSYINGNTITINNSSISVSKSDHTHTWQSITDKVVAVNEFNMVNAGYNGWLWINYLPVDDRDSSATIPQYNMGNGNKGLASVYAYRFKAEGKSCMQKDARDYAPFYSTYNGGFEPILDIKTVSGDWSIGSYDSLNNSLVFSFESDSDFNAGVDGTAQYYITTDGTFSGASRYINHTPGDPQSYMYSTSTGTQGGAIQIREVNGVLDNQNAWGFAPRITFHWGNRYAKEFGMRYDGQFAVNDIPIALTSNVLTFSNESADYLRADFNNPDFSKKAASKHIECWDSTGGWWNWMAGKFMKAGSSDAYVLLGGGGHKPLSEFQLGHTHDDEYLKLAGGTMNGNARIGHGSGNLYIGNSGNDGWIYTQDIASQKGTDKWAISESGAARFGFIHIASTNDNSLNGNLIESDSGYGIHLNYVNNGNVTLCNGGGAVTIGTASTDIDNNKLYVNGSEYINGASNVRDHVFANGFRHRSHNSNDSVLLAGGGYSQGVPVRYWAMYGLYIGSSSTDVTYNRRCGNYDFITSTEWESEGIVILNIMYPPRYHKYNTLIFGNGDHRDDSQWKTPVYVTITTCSYVNPGSGIRVMLSDDSTFNSGYANIYFMCMG